MILRVMLFLLCCSIGAMAQSSTDEITLRSGSGTCSAYIEADDSTIYLWNGKPVAYLDGEDVYGFNGKHLGWFIKGVIYDHDGDTEGAVTARFETLQPACPVKSFKHFKPFKASKEFRPLKPILSLSWADDMTLKGFLLRGED